MDPTIQLQCSNYLEFNNERSNGDGEDLISKMPDCILNSIISFLSTKDIIRTSIFSRRWRHLWTSMSNIDLDDRYSPKCKASFLDFVDRVLILHNDSDIKSFRLSFSARINPSRVNSWVSAVVNHKVQELHLSLPLEISFMLPCSLFTCESLAVFKLKTNRVLNVPTLVRFPNLKELHLSEVVLLNEDPIKRLFSNCPILQELTLADCRWVNIKKITISIPSLKTFRFSKKANIRDIVHDCTIEIYASNLVSLRYESDLKCNCILYDLPASVNASIDLLNLQEEVLDRVVNLLNHVQLVKSLSVTGNNHLEAGDLAARVSTFYKLATLRLQLEISSLNIGLLMDFLQKAPALEFLEIGIMDPYDDPDFNEDLELNVVPFCFGSHLRTISITYFNGYDEEMHLVELLLKNTVVLERMTIYARDDFLENSELVEKFHYQLKMFPRGSESCVVELLEGDL